MKVRVTFYVRTAAPKRLELMLRGYNAHVQHIPGKPHLYATDENGNYIVHCGDDWLRTKQKIDDTKFAKVAEWGPHDGGSQVL